MPNINPIEPGRWYLHTWIRYDLHPKVSDTAIYYLDTQRCSSELDGSNRTDLRFYGFSPRAGMHYWQLSPKDFTASLGGETERTAGPIIPLSPQRGEALARIMCPKLWKAYLTEFPKHP